MPQRPMSSDQRELMQRVPEPQLQLKSWLLPALVSLLLILQLAAPYRGWQVLLVGLGGMWLVSHLWARSLARGLRLTREMRFDWVHVGDRLLERFTLVNDSWLPALWIEIVDHSTMPEYQTGQATGVGGRGSTRWHKEAICTRRGLFILGPTDLHTGDPFGLYTVTLQYPDSLPLMVLPPIVPLPSIEVPPGGRAGEGRTRTDALERTVSAASVREYSPGDSLHWIHWRTSARHDSLFVRLFDSTPASDWWILLDMNRHVQAGEGPDATEEHAVILTASLADQGLRSGWAVGLAAYGEELVWLPPQEGKGQRWEILRALALVSLGSSCLAELLVRMQPMFGQHTSLVLITPDARGAWVESLVPLLRRGVIPTVLLLDPSSFGGAGDLTATQALLTHLGVVHYVINRDLLDRPKPYPVQRARWRAPTRQTRDMAWKLL
jgi:uncharacterized protein (DUF58 family)